MRFAVHGTLNWDPAESLPNETAAAEIVARALRINRECIQVVSIGLGEGVRNATMAADPVPEIGFVAEFGE